MASNKHEPTEANSIPWQRCMICLGSDCGLHGGHSKHSEVCAMPGSLHHMHVHLTRSPAMSTCANKTQSMTHIWQLQFAGEHALISIGAKFKLTHALDMLPNNHRCEQPKNIYPARIFCLKSLSLSLSRSLLRMQTLQGFNHESQQSQDKHANTMGLSRVRREWWAKV